ncbi:MAG: hypothetical protein J1F64_07220 [Oscillospiraceae bacterium]|nr:hypothetical protein [Oscillospiraceae bacterium]
MHWNMIKQDYTESGMNVNELAAKYKVTPNAIRYRIKKEGWIKPKNRDDISARIMLIADELLNKTEIAVEQLDTYMLHRKIKVKSIGYVEESGKPEKEMIEEYEKIQNVKGIIDRNELKILCSVLKELKSVYTGKDDEHTLGKLETLLKGLNDENIQHETA